MSREIGPRHYHHHKNGDREMFTTTDNTTTTTNTNTATDNTATDNTATDNTATDNTTTFALGDVVNGDLETFNTLLDAQEAYDLAVAEGARLNCMLIGEEGGYTDEDDAARAARDFYYIKKIEIIFDEDGDENEVETIVY